MNIRKIVGLIILTTFAILATGCKEDELADWELLELRQMEILLIIGEPQCNNVVDCRYIAFGAKPCGGAWGYLIYSITTVDSLNLARRVAEYNRFNALLNERYGLSSDCSVPISTVTLRSEEPSWVVTK